MVISCPAVEIDTSKSKEMVSNIPETTNSAVPVTKAPKAKRIIMKLMFFTNVYISLRISGVEFILNAMLT